MKETKSFKEHMKSMHEKFKIAVLNWLNRHGLAIYLTSSFAVICLGYISYKTNIWSLAVITGLLVDMPIVIGIDDIARKIWKKETEKNIRKEAFNDAKDEYEDKIEDAKWAEEVADTKYKEAEEKEKQASNIIERDKAEKEVLNMVTCNGELTLDEAKHRLEVFTLFEFRFQNPEKMPGIALKIARFALDYKCLGLFYPDYYYIDKSYMKSFINITNKDIKDIEKFLKEGSFQKAIAMVDKLTGMDIIKKKGGNGGGSGSEDSLFWELDHDLEHLEKLPEPGQPAHKKNSGIEIGD